MTKRIYINKWELIPYAYKIYIMNILFLKNLKTNKENVEHIIL